MRDGDAQRSTRQVHGRLGCRAPAALPGRRRRRSRRRRCRTPWSGRCRAPRPPGRSRRPRITRANSTLVRLGKRSADLQHGTVALGERAQVGAVVDEDDRVGVAHRHAREDGSVRSRAEIGSRSARSGPPGASGISSRVSRGRPISTATCGPGPSLTSSAQASTPAPVSMRRVGRRSAGSVSYEHLGDAADAVAAHLGFAAVGVQHAHARVAGLAGQDGEHAVAADAEPAIADGAHHRRVFGRRSAAGGRRRAGRPGRRSTTTKSFPSPSTLVNGSAMTPAEVYCAGGGGCRRLAAGAAAVPALAPLPCPGRRRFFRRGAGAASLAGVGLLACRFFAGGRGLGRRALGGRCRRRASEPRRGAALPAASGAVCARPWPCWPSRARLSAWRRSSSDLLLLRLLLRQALQPLRILLARVVGERQRRDHEDRPR